jgi:hypothetical protein
MNIIDLVKTPSGLKRLNKRIVLITSSQEYRKYVENSVDLKLNLDQEDIYGLQVIRGIENQIANSKRIRENESKANTNNS